MNKEQIISFIKEQVAAGKISNGDLLNMTQNTVTEHKEEAPTRNLTSVFYAIGGVIAVIGVAILVAQNWEEIGFAGRILVTLGISLVAYVVGLVMRSPESRVLSQVMFTISVALAPMGTFILLQEADVNFTLNVQILISLVLAVIYGVALLISKRNILSIFTLAFLTWTYFAVVLKIFDIENLRDMDILKWTVMILGFSYLLIAYGYGVLSKRATDMIDRREKSGIKSILYGLGTIGVLGAGISIGGAFDLIFIAFIFAFFYGSVYLKSTGILILASLFLIGHIIKLTARYFIDSINWPVALIITGFVVIGIGYLTYYLNKKFISSPRVS
ncbi:MAG: DUF2157 domain-containing protein [Patescibacteria group bacterium]